MSKEIVTHVRCDACELDGVVESGVEVRLAFVPQSARAIDLCERHLKELVEPLRTLVEEAGQPIVAGRTRPATKHRSPVATGLDARPDRRAPEMLQLAGGLWQCPDCERTGAVAGPLAQHWVATHETTKPGGVVDPLPDGSGWQCPECGRIAKSAAGLGGHRRTHGVQGSSPAIVYQRRAKGNRT